MSAYPSACTRNAKIAGKSTPVELLHVVPLPVGQAHANWPKLSKGRAA